MPGKKEPGDVEQPRHIDLGNRGIYHTGNRLNDLTGREWVFATKSVLHKSYPLSYQHHLRCQHGGQKPPELAEQLIRAYSKQGQLVLDPFMGVGGTLIGASIAGRRAVGVELNPRWVQIYEEVCRLENLAPQTVLIGDSRTVLPTLTQSVDLILTDVPYWDMDRRTRSSGNFKRAGSKSRERVPSTLTSFNPEATPQSKEDWLALLRTVFEQAASRLKPGGFFVVFIGDMYHSGRYHHLSGDVFRLLEETGLTPKADIIWYDPAKKLNIYGYLYDFIPSLVHQNILVFRKPTKPESGLGET